MIQRMNNVLIKHSKVLFGVITIIIIISFVWFFTPGADGSLLFSRNSNVIAKIGDVEVTTTDAERAQKSAVLGQAPAIYAAYGEKSVEFFKRMGRMGDDQLRILAATLKLAELQGFAVSDSEIQDVLKIEPAFQENGKFSAQKYDAFIKMLETVGYDMEDFENATRDALLLQKFQASAFAGVAVPTENEVMTDLKPYLFKYTAKIIGYKPFDIEKAVPQPTEAEIKAKFDADIKANPNAYAYPASDAMIFFINHKDVKVVDLEKKADNEFNKIFGNGQAQLTEEATKKLKENLKSGIITKEANALLAKIVKEAGEKPTAESLTAAAEKNGIKLQSTPVSDVTQVTAPSSLADQALLNSICAIKNVNELSPVVNNKNTAAVAMLTKRSEPAPLQYAAVKGLISQTLKAERFEQKLKEAGEKLNALRADIVNGKIALDKIEEEAKKKGLAVETQQFPISMAEMIHMSPPEQLAELNKWKKGYATPVQGNQMFVITDATPVEATEELKKVHSEYLFSMKQFAALQSWQVWYQKEIMAAISPYIQKQEQPAAE